MLESLLFSTNGRNKASSAFVLLQSTLATPWIPLARTILSKLWLNSEIRFVCLFCLYPPVDVLPDELFADKRVTVIDWTNDISGYASNNVPWEDNVEKMIQKLRLDSHIPLVLFVDSPDTLSENIDANSPSRTYKILKQWLSEVLQRPSPSRLLTHIPATSPLLPLVLPPSFSPSLIHVTLHPQTFIAHLIESYHTYPPSHPGHSSAKFWPLFTGISSRASGVEVEAMVWGSDGNGWASSETTKGDMVVEAVSRHPGGRQTVERTLEGWLGKGELVELADLPELKTLWKSGSTSIMSDTGHIMTQAPDPTRDLDLSFNLTLSEKQQFERSRVPLPYAHEGNPVPSTIYYDPDSADDIDEDDPDEDLDI